MGCPDLKDLRPGEKPDLEYRDQRLSFACHAFEFPTGWDCAYDFKFRSSFDGQGSGKGAWAHATKPTRSDALVTELRYWVARMESELARPQWSADQHKERNAAFEKFLPWLRDTLQAWDMPLFAEDPGLDHLVGSNKMVADEH